MDGRDAARIQPAKARGAARRARLWKTRAQAVVRGEGGAPIVFIRALKMPVWHRAAQIRRGIRVYLYLDLLFCDIRGASGFISFCGHPCRGMRGHSSSTSSPAHMRVRAWMTATLI